MASGDVHRCEQSAGKAQKVVQYHEFIGDKGPLKWHLEAANLHNQVIFIIEYCPFCGQNPDKQASQHAAPHEAIVDAIEKKSQGLAHLDKVIAEGGTISGGKFRTPDWFAEGRSQEVGALCALLDVLERIDVPDDKLEETTARLRAATGTYSHQKTEEAIEVLSARRSIPITT